MTARVSTTTIGERTVYHLHDDASGASASILPSYGFNLFDLKLPVRGRVLPLVVADPEFAKAPSRPARNGFPLLFPFPGRIRNASYAYGGKTYELTPNKAPHAIHGFAQEANWTVVEHAAESLGAKIVGEFRIFRDNPGAIGKWPADGIIRVAYTLKASRLRMEVTVENPSETPLPWGFGLHSYFRLPFDGRAEDSSTEVIVPADAIWTQKDNLPTGEILPVAGDSDYRSGRSMTGLEADIALTSLTYDIHDRGTCRLVDRDLAAEFRIVYDRLIREIVVFTPAASKGVIAIEPYTQMADAFSLAENHVDAGMRVLDPGQTTRFDLSFEVVEQAQG